MEYSGPASLADVEADLALSSDDGMSEVDWPPLALHTHKGTTPAAAGATPGLPHAVAPHSVNQASTSTKRPMDHSSDTNSEPSSPAAKTSRHCETSLHPKAPDYSLPRPNPQETPRQPAFVPPAFAPRIEYVKLLFRENPSVDVKLRWLSEVNKTFRLDRELAEVKMSAVTSRFVYISRRREYIINKVTNGEFLSLLLDVQDSVERPRKFPTYLITRYPVGVDPLLAKEFPGIYTARRFHQNGTPINRLVVTWSLPEPPPSDVSFSFLPCLPPCELRRMNDEQPWCYRCWGIGHISRYCSAPSDKCGWCAGNHTSRTCPHRTHSLPTTNDTTSTTNPPPSPAQDSSKWKCPRCHEPGVNVWHGCTRRSRPAASLTTTTLPPHSSRPPPPPPPRPPPPPPPRSLPGAAALAPVSSPTDSAEVLALRESVASLTSKCSALAARFDAIEARIDGLVNQFTTTERTLASLVESHQAIITTVTTFTEKLDALASRVEGFSELLLHEPSHRTPLSGAASSSSSPSVSRKPKARPP